MTHQKVIAFLLGILIVSWTVSVGLQGCAQFETIFNNPIPAMEPRGDGTNPSSPYEIMVDTYYSGYANGTYTEYLTFQAIENEIYFVYFDSPMNWDVELFEDPAFTILLGTSCPLPPFSYFSEYLFFSPNRTGAYYLHLYRSSSLFNLKFAVLRPYSYIINTSRIVVIGVETNPIYLFQVNLEEGNYSCNYGAVYAKLVRGWNYVIFPSAYNRFISGATTHLTQGSYGIVIEETCQFCLTSYPALNQTIPDDPLPEENKTTNTEGNGWLDGITPVFGVGVLLGLCVLYKFKKK